MRPDHGCLADKKQKQTMGRPTSLTWRPPVGKDWEWMAWGERLRVNGGQEKRVHRIRIVCRDGTLLWQARGLLPKTTKKEEKTRRVKKGRKGHLNEAGLL